MYKSIIVFIVCATAHPWVFCQSDSSTVISRPVVEYSGYVDVFYAYDANCPINEKRQPFLYNFNRHNNFNLNLGMIKASLQHIKYRGNIALHAGTYVEDNYAGEPRALQNISEANIGVALNTKKTLWADAGIFASYIGFESAIAKDQWTVTRSLLAENSPYYLSGAKLSYKANNNWNFTAIICNGWQRIAAIRGNSLPAFGTQVTYTKNDIITLNWSTFYGSDYPDSTRRMRLYNNLYCIYQPYRKWGITVGFDIGKEQTQKGSSAYNTWFSPVIIVRYNFSNKWACALRAEWYSDENNVIIKHDNNVPFNTKGGSFNIDYAIDKRISWRIEGRYFNSTKSIFLRNNEFVHNNFSMVTSLAVAL